MLPCERFQVLDSDGEQHYCYDYQYIRDQRLFICDTYIDGSYYMTEEVTKEDYITTWKENMKKLYE